MNVLKDIATLFHLTMAVKMKRGINEIWKMPYQKPLGTTLEVKLFDKY